MGVHFGTRLLVMKRTRPLFQPRFVVPTRKDIDHRLVIGAALFGAGWGLAGYCPGPALTALATTSGAAWLFLLAMAGGMLIFAAYDRLARRALVPHEVPDTSAQQPLSSSS